MLKATLLALAVLTHPVAADDLPLPVPALYDVHGVLANDVLNIRRLPSSNAELVGSLAPDAVGVEVVAFSRKSEWALVNSGELSGWVFTRFLVPAAVELDASGLPKGLACFATEPFWYMTFTPDGVAISSADAPERALHDLRALSPDPVTDLALGARFTWAVQDGDDADPVSEAMIVPGHCSDGMSDRRYGLHIFDQVLGHGCCSLAP